MACRNITYEPCTLVYTLLNDKKLSFDDFSLIVRSLHSYMVESVTPNKDLKNVQVRLSYQASVTNAQNKLGKLRNIIGISKLSQHVDQSEFPRLEQLRAKYGLTCGENEPVQPRGRGVGPTRGKQIFRRPNPYPKTKPAATVTPAASTFSTNVSELYDISDDEASTLPDAQPTFDSPTPEIPEQPFGYYTENEQ